VFKDTDNACAPSMTDDRTANFGAAQYTVKYSNFTLDDKLLNFKPFSSETQNAVLHWAFELNSAAAATETGI
jgi:hypothetical protein